MTKTFTVASFSRQNKIAFKACDESNQRLLNTDAQAVGSIGVANGSLTLFSEKEEKAKTAELIKRGWVMRKRVYNTTTKVFETVDA